MYLCLWAWVNGTGKTVTSLNVFKKFNTEKILIICLISKMNDWKEDLKDECNIDAVILDKGSTKNKQMVENSDTTAFIINFESAWRCDNLLKWVDRNTTVLIDESHLIKNPTSKIGRFCRLLSCKTKHKLILTGTPQSQGYIDYYNQLYFCDLNLNISYIFIPLKSCSISPEFNSKLNNFVKFVLALPNLLASSILIF